jgi:hypothetical protein
VLLNTFKQTIHAAADTSATHFFIWLYALA